MKQYFAHDTREYLTLREPPPRMCWFATGHSKGRISYHKSFAAAARSWRFGGAVFGWRLGEWHLYTSAGWL